MFLQMAGYPSSFWLNNIHTHTHHSLTLLFTDSSTDKHFHCFHMGLTPGQGTKIPYAVQPKKEKQTFK